MRPSTPPPLIGTTVECFEHFISQHPNIECFELIAEFCRRTLATVIEWRGEVHKLNGESLLRLRIFLKLAGYEVSEYNVLGGDLKQLALIVGIGIVDPTKANSDLGYNTEGSRNRPASLLRLTLHPGDGPVRPQRLRNFIATHGPRLKSGWPNEDSEIGAEQYWIERIKAVTKQPAPQKTTSEPASPPLDPLETATLARSITALTPLAQYIADKGGALAVRKLGRGGQDIAELIGVLQRLLKEEE